MEIITNKERSRIEKLGIEFLFDQEPSSSGQAYLKPPLSGRAIGVYTQTCNISCEFGYIGEEKHVVYVCFIDAKTVGSFRAKIANAGLSFVFFGRTRRKLALSRAIRTLA